MTKITLYLSKEGNRTCIEAGYLKGADRLDNLHVSKSCLELGPKDFTLFFQPEIIHLYEALKDGETITVQCSRIRTRVYTCRDGQIVLTWTGP